MSAILRETPVDLDEILYQSVVDEEFRSQLLADPSLMGLGDRSVTLPAPIEPQDTAGLDLAVEDYYISMCMSTCSSGFTFICDGTTK